MLKRSLRPAAMVGALAVAAAGAVFSLTPATAAVVGKSTFSQPTGNVDTLLSISTSAPCAAPAVKVRAIATGFGFPANGQILYAPQTIGFSTTAPMNLAVSNSFRVYSTNNASTALVGPYDVRVQCVNSLGSVIFDEFQTTMYWTTPGNSFANIDAASYTTVAPNTTFTVTGAPSLTSTPKVGTAVAATGGSFTPNPTGRTYQWLRNGANIGGATGTSYTPTAADKGASLSVKVTVTAAGITTLSATSAGKTVAAGTFAVKKAPKTTGTAKVGKKLTAVKGTYTPSATSYSYQWQRGGKNISKATKAKYTLTKKDKGKKVRVKITVKKAGYTNLVTTSAARKIK